MDMKVKRSVQTLTTAAIARPAKMRPEDIVLETAGKKISMNILAES